MNEGIIKKLNTLGDIELSLIMEDSVYISYPADINQHNKFYLVKIEDDCVVFANDDIELLIPLNKIMAIEKVKKKY